MAFAQPARLGQAAAEDEKRQYGDTVVETGAYAHLGNHIQQFNFGGGLHLNLHPARRTIIDSPRTRIVRKEHWKGLKRCREVLAAIAEILDDDLRHTWQSAAKFRHKSTPRKVLSATRHVRAKVQKGCRTSGRRGA